MDDLKRRVPEDPTKININQDWEVDYWSGKFKITPKKLKEIVASVGVLVKDVEIWLLSEAIRKK